MKFAVTMIALAAMACSTQAMATEVSASVSVESDFLYRGVNLSEMSDDISVGGTLQFSDVFVDGAYVRTTANTLALEDFDVSTRAEFSVGYARSFGPLNIDGSLNRVFNPGLYTYDFNEARVRAGIDVTDSVEVFGEIAQQIGASTDGDLYANIGVGYRDAFGVSGLSMEVAASGMYYNDRGGVERFNNAQFTAQYNITDNFAVYGKYSYGGKTWDDRDLPEVGMVGVSMGF